MYVYIYSFVLIYSFIPFGLSFVVRVVFTLVLVPLSLFYPSSPGLPMSTTKGGGGEILISHLYMLITSRSSSLCLLLPPRVAQT